MFKQVKLLSKFIILTSFLLGCSGNYAFNSNLKATGSKQYFSASNVEIYENEQEFNGNFQFIGLVEGEDCQRKTHLAPPDPIIARTQARQQAYAKEANAVIFTACVDIDSNACINQVVCYAKAYRISADESSAQSGNQSDSK